MPERFTSGNVREMHFDNGKATRTNRIVKCDGRVRVARRIENNTNEAFIGCATNTGNKLAFVVRLQKGDIDVFGHSDGANGLFDVGECRGSVDGCFAFSEPVEVGTGNDENMATR